MNKYQTKAKKQHFVSLYYCLLLILIFTSCHAGRTIIWNFGDYDDYKKFETQKIENKIPSHHFSSQPINLNINKDLDQLFLKGKKLELFLEDTKSTSFIVLKQDTIIYENYFNEHQKEDLHCMNSVSKSFISILIGIALQDEKIQSVKEPITNYIDELLGTPYEKVTIEDLLDMKSGVDFSEAYYNPFGDLAKFYYGTNMRKHLQKLTVQDTLQRFEYVSANTDFLGWVLEKAVGKSVPEYLEEKIWKPLNMTYAASWSLDSKKHQVPKYSYGLNTRSIDLLKLGYLCLNKGTYHNAQIINEDWIDQIHHTFVDDSKNKIVNYKNHWWKEVIYTDSLTQSQTQLDYGTYEYVDKAEVRHKGYIVPTGNYYAAGFLGQFVYIYPSKNIVIIRTGKKQGKVDWIKFFSLIGKAN